MRCFNSGTLVKIFESFNIHPKYARDMNEYNPRKRLYMKKLDDGALVEKSLDELNERERRVMIRRKGIYNIDLKLEDDEKSKLNFQDVKDVKEAKDIKDTKNVKI